MVNHEKGEAVFEDGGAGMILQIYTLEEKPIKRGDRVVLLRYEETTHSYEVIHEENFL